MGHDIIDCLDESDIRLEREIKQAIDRKQKELNKNKQKTPRDKENQGNKRTSG